MNVRERRSKLMSPDQLPPTRLELRWRIVENDPEWPLFCDYHLVLELDSLDLRGEVYGDDGELIRRDRSKRVELGGTRSGNAGRKLIHNGLIETPYRDGAHIKWDSERLGLPMFVVSEPDGVAQQMFHSVCGDLDELDEETAI